MSSIQTIFKNQAHKMTRNDMPTNSAAPWALAWRIITAFSRLSIKSCRASSNERNPDLAISAASISRTNGFSTHGALPSEILADAMSAGPSQKGQVTSAVTNSLVASFRLMEEKGEGLRGASEIINYLQCLYRRERDSYQAMGRGY